MKSDGWDKIVRKTETHFSKKEPENMLSNGWQKIEKKRGVSGMYDKYDGLFKVIVPNEKKPVHLAITAKCYLAIGKPKTVEIWKRGTNVAIVPTEAADGYRISNMRGKTPSRLFYVAVKTWLQEARLKVGVYEAHEENGMIVFDMAQTPAVIGG